MKLVGKFRQVEGELLQRQDNGRLHVLTIGGDTEYQRDVHTLALVRIDTNDTESFGTMTRIFLAVESSIVSSILKISSGRRLLGLTISSAFLNQSSIRSKLEFTTLCIEICWDGLTR